MGGRRWDKSEDRALMDGVGVFSVDWFRRRSGSGGSPRSRSAVYARAASTLGPGGLRRGTYTLGRAARETGYTRGQILRGQRALGQKWKRLSPRGHYLITFDQLDEITGWLQKDYWCAKLRLYGCTNCGDRQTAVRGGGQCARCYGRLRRLAIKHGVPTRSILLREFVRGLGVRGLQIRRIQECLQRRWGLTETQLRYLIDASSS